MLRQLLSVFAITLIAACGSGSDKPGDSDPSEQGTTYMNDYLPWPPEGKEVKTTESGLQYIIVKEGEGDMPTARDRVVVHYEGRLPDGEKFDSSYERGMPAVFGVTQVISGWTEGLQYVSEGGMIELWVPSYLGYGEQGSPGSIPPHSNLSFIVELVRVR